MTSKLGFYPEIIDDPISDLLLGLFIIFVFIFVLNFFGIDKLTAFVLIATIMLLIGIIDYLRKEKTIIDSIKIFIIIICLLPVIIVFTIYYFLIPEEENKK